MEPSRARAFAHQRLIGIATRVPPHRGPRVWRRFATRSRVAEAGQLAAQDPHGALSLVLPVLSAGAGADGVLRTVVRVLGERGETAAALDQARLAVQSGTAADLPMLLTYRELAQRERREADLQMAFRAIAAHVPRSQGELDRSASVLRFSDRDLVQQYHAMLSSHPSTEGLFLEPVEAAIDELELLAAHANGETDRFERKKEHVIARRAHPLRIMASVLLRDRAWQELVRLLADYDTGAVPGLRAEKFPSSQVELAARNAFKDGCNAAAAALARRALVARPAVAAMVAIRDEAEDQLGLRERGWQVPAPSSSSYEPAPRAVLSLLGQSLPIRSGGYATRSHGILTGLADRGWDMRAVTRLGFPYDLWWKPDDPRDVAAIDVVDGVPYHRLLTPGVRRYPRYPLQEYVEEGADRIVALAQEHRAGLVHAASLYDVGLTGLTAARRLGVPFIYEMRGLKQLLEGARNPNFAQTDRHEFLDLMEGTVAREADAVFVITAALGREMVRMGVPEERLRVVPNGVHAKAFRPQQRDRELEASLGLAGKTVIGYAGGIVQYEGLELLMDAAARLGATRRDFHVLIVGDGSHDVAVRHRAAELGLEEVVTFTGRVPHEEVHRYLSLVDIAPFPRLPLPVCELISPIKPFEAMAMGKSVVVSDVAALTEFVEDGATGRSFRKGDLGDLVRVLTELLDSPDQRRALGKAGREWVIRERDWSSITAKVDHAYQEVLADARRDQPLNVTHAR